MNRRERLSLIEQDYYEWGRHTLYRHNFEWLREQALKLCEIEEIVQYVENDDVRLTMMEILKDAG